MSTCADCKYYSEDAAMNANLPPNHPRYELMARGTCHRFPPTGSERRQREQVSTRVSSSYWCGEWTSKP